jgi:hypothetical protein
VKTHRLGKAGHLKPQPPPALSFDHSAADAKPLADRIQLKLKSLAIPWLLFEAVLFGVARQKFTHHPGRGRTISHGWVSF